MLYCTLSGTEAQAEPEAGAGIATNPKRLRFNAGCSQPRAAQEGWHSPQSWGRLDRCCWRMRETHAPSCAFGATIITRITITHTIIPITSINCVYYHYAYLLLLCLLCLLLSILLLLLYNLSCDRRSRRRFAPSGSWARRARRCWRLY